MKKLFCFIAILLFITLVPITTLAASITLAWDYEDGTSVQGFTMYYYNTADSANVYNKTVADPAAREMTIDNLQPGTSYTFYVTAYNTTGESDHSNEVTGATPDYTPPPDKEPVIIHIPGPSTLIIPTQ